MKRRTYLSKLLKYVVIIAAMILLFTSLAHGQQNGYAWGRGISALQPVAIAADTKDNAITANVFTDSVCIAGMCYPPSGMALVKYDSSGTLLWYNIICKDYQNVVNSAKPLDVTTDSSDNIYLFGYTTDTLAYQHAAPGYFLAKYTPAGVLAYVKYFDNKNSIKKGNVAVSGDQNSIYVSFAFTDSLVLPLSSNLHTYNSQNYAFALLQLDRNGVYQNHLEIGGKAPWISDISCALPSSGNITMADINRLVTFVGTYDSLSIVSSVFHNGSNVLTGTNAFSGSFTSSYYNMYSMVNILPGRAGYLEPTAIRCDSTGHNFITGQIFGDVSYKPIWAPLDTVSSIAGTHDMDVFYARDTIGLALDYMRVIQSLGGDTATDIVRTGDSTILVSMQLWNGGFTLAGNTINAGNLLLAFADGMHRHPTNGNPLWAVQQMPNYGYTAYGLAKGPKAIFVTGNIRAQALFGRDTIIKLARPDVGVVAKLGIPDPCNLTATIGGTDTIVQCQTATTIDVLGAGGSGHYSYRWSPGYLLVDSTDFTVAVNQQVDRQKFTVIITDSVTGCSAKDSVVISTYLIHRDTLYSCNGAAVTLDMGAGALMYDWVNVTPALSQTAVVDSPNIYAGVATYAVCGAITSTFTVIDSCPPVADLVWPGDANSDGTADLYDVLNIGIGYNNTGPVRTNASSVWIGQAATDWQLQFLNGLNLKHADCDGNGRIDSFDVDVVAANYGLTHQKAEQAQANPRNPDLYVQFTTDTATNRNLVTADVFLGKINKPVANAYGLAFSLFYDPMLVDTGATVSYANSWLGQGSGDIRLEKNNYTNGKMDLAYSRINHTNVNGYGKVASVSFYIQDNIIGKQDSLCKKLALQISGAKLVSSTGLVQDLNIQNDTMVIYQLVSGINEAVNSDAQIDVYPNPGNGKFYLNVKGNDVIQKVTLLNTIGQTILTNTYEQRNGTYLFDSGQQTAGIYFLKMETDKRVLVKRVVIK